MTLETIAQNNDYLHLALAGKMDIAGVASVEKEFLEEIGHGERSAIVDFSGVTFIGSMGLRTLLVAVKNLRSGNKKLIILNPQKLVAEVFDASGILDILLVSHTLSEAESLAKT